RPRARGRFVEEVDDRLAPERGDLLDLTRRDLLQRRRGVDEQGDLSRVEIPHGAQVLACPGHLRPPLPGHLTSPAFVLARRRSSRTNGVRSGRLLARALAGSSPDPASSVLGGFDDDAILTIVLAHPHGDGLATG